MRAMVTAGNLPEGTKLRPLEGQATRVDKDTYDIKADAIVVAPADSRALVPALARAGSAGIVIINIDNRLEPEILAEYDLQIPFIGPSNLTGAKMVGDFALQGLAGDSEVAILEGVTSAINSIQRRTGLEQAVAEAGMEVVTLQSGEWDQTKAAQVTSAILSQFPELDVILAANDSMALGAASAVGLAALDHDITTVSYTHLTLPTICSV